MNSTDDNIKFDIENYNEDKKIYLNIAEKIFARYNLKNENKFKISLCRYFENDFELNQDLKDILKGKDI
jgi:hypothetical protein